LYWITDAPITKGAYVMFCPPERKVFVDAKERGYIDAGFCPGNFGHLMKKILAAKGDTIAVTPQGVTVNGEVLPYSKPVAEDGVGRPLPQLPRSVTRWAPQSFCLCRIAALHPSMAVISARLLAARSRR
jgi:conjugative transfer signal peptidase TraF